MFEETGPIQNKKPKSVPMVRMRKLKAYTCMFTDDASELSKLRLMENSTSDTQIDRREQAQFHIGWIRLTRCSGALYVGG